MPFTTYRLIKEENYLDLLNKISIQDKKKEEGVATPLPSREEGEKKSVYDQLKNLLNKKQLNLALYLDELKNFYFNPIDFTVELDKNPLIDSNFIILLRNYFNFVRENTNDDLFSSFVERNVTKNLKRVTRRVHAPIATSTPLSNFTTQGRNNTAIATSTQPQSIPGNSLFPGDVSQSTPRGNDLIIAGSSSLGNVTPSPPPKSLAERRARRIVKKPIRLGFGKRRKDFNWLPLPLKHGLLLSEKK